MKYITDGVRVDCASGPWGLQGVCTAQKKKNAHNNAFSNAPLRDEGRAFSKGWGALLAISSSQLVPYGPADRRGVGTRGVSGVRRTRTFLSLSIYLSF